MTTTHAHEWKNFGENDGNDAKCKREVKPIHEWKNLGRNDSDDMKYRREGSWNSRFIPQQTRTLKGKFQLYRPVQVWDWLFKSCEVNGRILLHDGLISAEDIEECLMKGNCKTLSIKLPAWTLLQCLLTSAKSNSDGLVITDDAELTRMNEPRDKVFEWFYWPLLIMKEQLKNLELKETEEICLKELVIRCKNEIPEEWDGAEFPSNSNIRRAQLQALIRRLQGIVVSMSRIPTFRRRFRNLVKVLYIEALQARASGSHTGANLITKYIEEGSIQSTDVDVDKSSSNVNHTAYQGENMVCPA